MKKQIWSVQESANNAGYLVIEENWPVLSTCQTNSSPKEASQEQALKNATLAAAAPDMYEALKYVIDWHREHDSGEGELFGLDFVTTAINATRKAEGK